MCFCVLLILKDLMNRMPSIMSRRKAYLELREMMRTCACVPINSCQNSPERDRIPQTYLS